MDNFFFDPKEYLNKIYAARKFIQKLLPRHFKPTVALTLGSGGLGELSSLINPVCDPLPYNHIPGFSQTTVIGHEGKLILGKIENIPVVCFKGRLHYYEMGPQPNQVIALKRIMFPVYVASSLGSKIYFATNAAGGLNSKYKPGDLMIVQSHLDLFYPNPLIGPIIDLNDSQRFIAQNNQYQLFFRKLLMRAAKNVGQEKSVREGVYCVLTGPTFESQTDSSVLRKLEIDAVGMSTVPEIIVATSLGMKTIALSLITNVIAKDGTNATSHQEVMRALVNPATKKRVRNIIREFFKLLYPSALKL